MITVKSYSDLDTIEVDINGHADYAEEGKDIVCAAISVLAQTFYAFMEKTYGVTVTESIIKKGCVHFKVSHHKDNFDWVESAYEMFVEGIKGVEKAYPNCVTYVGGIKNFFEID